MVNITEFFVVMGVPVFLKDLFEKILLMHALVSFLTTLSMKIVNADELNRIVVVKEIFFALH